MTSDKSIIPVERIESHIYLIRGQKIMLSADLAELYGVEPRIIVQAVKRNIERFPADFIFRLTLEESRGLKSQVATSSYVSSSCLRSQIVILKRGQHVKYPPYAFTEQGVAMLSSVLNSPRAVQVNIAIMRVFVRLREFLASNAEVARKLQEHDEQIQTLFDAIRRLMNPPGPARRQIGFHVREHGGTYRARLPRERRSR